jgi:hypothetical protein
LVVSSVVLSSVVVPPMHSGWRRCSASSQLPDTSATVEVVVTGGVLGRAIVPVGTRAAAAGGASELPDARYTAGPRPAGNP